MQCTVCGAALPAIRRATNLRQLLWGGWTCPGCQCELNRYGQPVDSTVAFPDRVVFRFGRRSRLPALRGVLGAAVGGLGVVLVALLGLVFAVEHMYGGLVVGLLAVLALAGITVPITLAVQTAFGHPRILQVGLHGLHLDGRKIPYAAVRSIEETPEGFVLNTDGGVETVRGPPEVHAALLDAVLKYRSNQQAGEALDPAQAASLAGMLDRS